MLLEALCIGIGIVKYIPMNKKKLRVITSNINYEKSFIPNFRHVIN